MKSGIFFALFIMTMILFTSCGSTRFVEPLKKRENAVAAEFGGPIVNVPGVATTPLPFTSLTYGRGVTNRLTLHGSWHTTAALFGVAQFDFGGTYGIWKSENRKHGVSGMLGFNTGFDVFENNFKLWPKLDAHYYFKYNQKSMVQDDLLTSSGKSKANLLYVGLGSWYELETIKAHGERQEDFVIPMLNLGHDLNWRKWTFKTEIKLIAPFNSNENVVLDYFSLTGKNGATGVYLGFIRKF